MTLTEIKEAISNKERVYWSSLSYEVILDSKNQYLILHNSGSAIGLTWADGITLNGKEEDFFIA